MSASAKSLLRDVRIVLHDRVIEHGALLIESGRIARVSEGSGSDGSHEYDCAGLTLFPGFIDVHIHGAMGVDTLAANGADLARVSQFLATCGVTGWLPTLVPASTEEYGQAIKAIDDASSSTEGSRILGVHYEGPFVNSAQCGALHEQFFRSYKTPTDLDDLPTPGAAGAKRMITLAPEIAGGLELVRELNRRGWIVSIGHTRATYDLLEQVAAAGARHLTHFMNAMPSLHHRAPGPIGWALFRDDVTCDFIADGIHLDPQMLRLLLKLKGAVRLSLISDAIAATGMGDGNYEIWGETITVKNGRTSNRGGTIAGSVITMHDAARLMLSLGASEIEVARMAATNPARLLRIDQDCGSIEEGKRADLVAVDASGNIAFTMIGGKKSEG